MPKKKVDKSVKAPTKHRKEKKPTDKLADKTALTKFLQGVWPGSAIIRLSLML